MTEETIKLQTNDTLVTKQDLTDVGDKKSNQPHPIFVKREKPVPKETDKIVEELTQLFERHKEDHPNITAEEAKIAIQTALKHSDPAELYRTMQQIDQETLAQDIADTAQKIKAGTYEEPKETKQLTRREEYLKEKHQKNVESGARYMSDKEHDAYADKVIGVIKDTITGNTNVKGVALPQSSMWDRKYFAPDSKSRFTDHSDIDLRLITEDEETFREISKIISDRIHEFDPDREVHFFRPLLTKDSVHDNRAVLEDDYSVMTDTDTNVAKEIVLPNSDEVMSVVKDIYEGDAVVIEDYTNKVSDETDRNIPETSPSTNIEQLPDSKVKITQPDGSFVTAKRGDDGSLRVDRMKIPKGLDERAVRDSLRERVTDYARESGAPGISGEMSLPESLRDNIKRFGDNLTLRNPQTGDELTSTQAAERISRGDKVQYEVDMKAEPVPENRRVPQAVEDARKSIQNRDFRAFDELEQKLGPDSPWIESLRREAIRDGVRTHDVSPDKTHHRRSLREKAETWEREKKEEEEFRAKHPYRAKAQDLRKTIDQGNTGSKIGRENPHTQWLERYQQQSEKWQEGETDWPQPIEPSDEYIEYANPQYTGLAEHLPPGLVRNDNGDLQYTTPDTGGWPITHTPGEPWRPENVTPGVSNRMNEIPNSEWDARGVEGLNERDVMKQLVEELFRRQMEEDETQRREERKIRERNRQEKEKRQREIEEKKKQPEGKEVKEKVKDHNGEPSDKKPKDNESDRKEDAKKPSDRGYEDEKTPDSRKVDKRPGDDDETSGKRPDTHPDERSKAPDLKGPQLPSPDDFDDLVEGPRFIDRVREKMAERREADAARREGYEPTPRGPGVGAQAGAELRRRIDDWIKKNADTLQRDLDNDWGGTGSDDSHSSTPSRSMPTLPQIQERIGRMTASELREAMQDAAFRSGNIEQFMQTPVGNTGKTLGEYYERVEEGAAHERGVDPGEYRGPSTMNARDMQNVMQTIKAPTNVNTIPGSEQITRAPDPDPTAPTARDAEAMHNIRDILSK